LIKLLPECIKCNSPVTDSVEPEVEQHKTIKKGRYIADNHVWICDECRGMLEKDKSYSVSKNDNQDDLV
jgi:uncharacterized protein with PIN domain